MIINRDKHGVSNVVTTMLIILVAMLAIAVLASVVIHIVNSPKLSPAFSCVDWKLTPPLTIQNACYNTTTQDLIVEVYRSSNSAALTMLDFVIESGAVRTQWQCGESCGGCSLGAMNSMKTYYFAVGDVAPSQVSLRAESCLFTQKDISRCS